MRIVMLSDLETVGGAAIAAGRLAVGLAGTGAEVIRLVRFPDGRRHRWRTEIVEPPAGSLYGRARRSLRSWVGRDGPTRTLSALLHDVAPDVVNVHNIHGAGWGPDVVETCLDHAPTGWTLHDMWSFSGRCAYSYDCRKFITGCDATCPTPDEYPALRPGRIAGAWQARRRALGKNPALVAVCPSQWLAQNARAGLWKYHRVEVIPYGLPLATYVPLDRAAARAELGLPAPGAVVSFVANVVSERRKGGELLAQALESVKTRPLTVLVLGRGELKLAPDGIKVCTLGFVEDEHRRALAYSAADVMVHPAPVDNLPNVVMEAIACGTPCVGFAVGGVPELVRPGLTGWLAERVTPEALGAALDAAIVEVRDGRDLRVSCRGVAEREYDDRLQAGRYLTLFASLGAGAGGQTARLPRHP